MIYVLKIIWDYWGAAIGTYRPQYRPLSAIRYLDANPLPTCNTLFSTLSIYKVTSQIFHMMDQQGDMLVNCNLMSIYVIS
jgi:hypothetical protein